MKISRVIKPETASPMTVPSDFQLNEDVAMVMVEDGTARLLDMAGSFYALTESAASLLEAALRLPTHRAAQEVAERFSADLKQVEGDIHALLADLQAKGVVCCKNEARVRRLPRLRSAKLLLHPVLKLTRSSVLSLPQKATLLLGAAFLSERWFGWTTTLVVWQESFNNEAAATPTDAQFEQISQIVQRQVAKHWFNVECKERALCSWALFRSSRTAAALTVGIDLYPFASHAWCEAKGRIVADFADRCAKYTVIHQYC